MFSIVISFLVFACKGAVITVFKVKNTVINFNNKLFDYMIAGKPVLAGSSAPTARVLEETKPGLALDFKTPAAAAQAIETMLLPDTEMMSKNVIVATNEKYNWSMDAGVLLNFIGKFM